MPESPNRRLVTEEVFLTTEAKQDARTAVLEAAAGFDAPPLALQDEVVSALITDPASIARTRLATYFQPRIQIAALSTKDHGVYIRDTGSGIGSTMRYEDEAQHEGSIMNLHHRGAGPEGNQAYGINIANHPGAKHAFCIHQYSGRSAMVRLDNTDVAPAIQVYNTENQTMNPGNVGTGDFLDFKPWQETKKFRLTDALTWVNETAKSVLFDTATAVLYGLGVRVTKDIPALFVHKNSPGAGPGVSVINEGTSPGVEVVQNGAGNGFRVTAGPTHGTYIAHMRGQVYGTEASTEVDGGNTLSVNKKSAGSGNALVVRNAGTGSSAQFLTGTATVARISAAGEYEHLTNGLGIILRSPNGTRHRITVADDGALKATVIS